MNTYNEKQTETYYYLDSCRQLAIDKGYAGIDEDGYYFVSNTKGYTEFIERYEQVRAEKLRNNLPRRFHISHKVYEKYKSTLSIEILKMTICFLYSKGYKLDDTDYQDYCEYIEGNKIKLPKEFGE